MVQHLCVPVCPESVNTVELVFWMFQHYFVCADLDLSLSLWTLWSWCPWWFSICVYPGPVPESVNTVELVFWMVQHLCVPVWTCSWVWEHCGVRVRDGSAFVCAHLDLFLSLWTLWSLCSGWFSICVCPGPVPESVNTVEFMLWMAQHLCVPVCPEFVNTVELVFWMVQHLCVPVWTCSWVCEHFGVRVLDGPVFVCAGLNLTLSLRTLWSSCSGWFGIRVCRFRPVPESESTVEFVLWAVEVVHTVASSCPLWAKRPTWAMQWSDGRG